MMLNGCADLPIGSSIKYGFKSPARNLARLVDKMYGKVIDAPLILILKHILIETIFNLVTK